jgi:hypothetical protein
MLAEQNKSLSFALASERLGINEKSRPVMNQPTLDTKNLLFL